MKSDQPNACEAVLLESAHVCPRCGNTVSLQQLALREMTTGIIICLNCAWSGQINIKIIEKRLLE
jgi:transcription elongation factor Elf1